MNSRPRTSSRCLNPGKPLLHGAAGALDRCLCEGFCPNCSRPSAPAGGCSGPTGEDMIQAQGDFNRPWLSVLRNRDPARLAGGRSARVSRPPARGRRGLWLGWAAIAIARPTRTSRRRLRPRPDLDRARHRDRRAGRRGRAGELAVRDAADPSASGQYDVAVIWRRSTTWHGRSRCWPRCGGC